MEKTDTKFKEVKCHSCGTKLIVPIDYVGCPFCFECQENDSSWSANSENFKKL